MKTLLQAKSFCKSLVIFISIVLLLVITNHEVFGKGKKRLLFHAGAGQRPSLDEIAEIFQQRHPDVRVDFSYKGSGYFLADMTISKEGDLYMPGEEFYLLQADKRGFVADYNPETDIAAYFVTVIITPKGNPKNIKSVADFAKSGTRVGLGDPKACAIGIWHETIFKKAGILENVRKNATMNAKTIPELGNACQLKAIDATIVWATTAMLYLKDIEIIPMEPKYRGLIRLPVAILKFCRYPKETKELKNFILSDEGKKIFHSHAYCIDPNKVDEDMKWLVEASKVAKDPSIPVTEETVGPFVKEVKRQRETKR
ncbi:MAG: extracellular solute-binding protein [Candidatus Hydrogenedentota bacterium]